MGFLHQNIMEWILVHILTDNLLIYNQGIRLLFYHLLLSRLARISVVGVHFNQF